jgi:transcriptional regulator with XRE-family HTH domain
MLRTWRANLGVSGDELTVRAGLESERYRQIESGLSEPNLGELSSIAAAFDKSPSELVNQWEGVSMIPRAVRRDVLGGASRK